MPNDGDPRFAPLSESVVGQAVDDWYYFLPIAFLKDRDSLARLRSRLPQSSAFEGLIVEINDTEIVRNLRLARRWRTSSGCIRLPFR